MRTYGLYRAVRHCAAMLVCALVVAPPCWASDIYWTDFSRSNSGGISRSDTQTIGRDVLISTGLNSPYRIAIDSIGEKMYWTSTYTGDVLRANLDGTEVETIVDSGNSLLGIAVDGVAGKVYWSSGADIFRANLDGSGETVFLSVGATELVQDLTIDTVSSKLYLSNFSGVGPGKLQRVNLNGTNLEDVVTGVANGPIGLGVDADGAKAHWAEYNLATGLGGVGRANLDGSQLETIVTGAGADSVVLDLGAGKLYWTEPEFVNDTGVIRRADLDGSNAETLALGGIFPGGVAVVPEPTSLCLMALAAWLVTRRRI